MNKKVAQKTDLKFKQAFPGLKGVDIMSRAFAIEPILVFTEFRMDKPVFGPHPHAGISVMTYMLPDSNGSFINRDSQGDFSIIEPGGMHIMQAGRGMHHDEFPKENGVETHGFQIWINHSNANRMVEPLSMHAFANEVPEVQTTDYKVRIVHGNFEGMRTPYSMVTDISILHIFIQSGKEIFIPTKEMAFAYGLQGMGVTESAEIGPQTLINYELSGNMVHLKGGEGGLELMFVTGTPHNEPITFGGPFVMTTPEQMAQTQLRYAKGEMGILEPFLG